MSKLKYRNLITAILFGAVLTLVSAGNAYAFPENSHKADNNPQVVSYHPAGTHGIVGEYEDHSGSDLVMEAGNSGVFQQWFLGYSESEEFHGEHSLWVPAKDSICSNGWIFVADPNPAWGTHFPDNTDYCVHTNDYALGL